MQPCITLLVFFPHYLSFLFVQFSIASNYDFEYIKVKKRTCGQVFATPSWIEQNTAKRESRTVFATPSWIEQNTAKRESRTVFFS